MSKTFKIKKFLIIEGIFLLFILIGFWMYGSNDRYGGYRTLLLERTLDIIDSVLPICPSHSPSTLMLPYIPPPCSLELGLKDLGLRIINIFGSLATLYFIVFIIYRLIELKKKKMETNNKI